MERFLQKEAHTALNAKEANFPITTKQRACPAPMDISARRGCRALFHADQDLFHPHRAPSATLASEERTLTPIRQNALLVQKDTIARTGQTAHESVKTHPFFAH